MTSQQSSAPISFNRKLKNPSGGLRVKSDLSWRSVEGFFSFKINNYARLLCWSAGVQAAEGGGLGNVFLNGGDVKCNEDGG